MGCRLKGEKDICIYYLEGECFKSCANYKEDSKEQLKKDYKLYLKERNCSERI